MGVKVLATGVVKTEAAAVTYYRLVQTRLYRISVVLASLRHGSTSSASSRLSWTTGW